MDERFEPEWRNGRRDRLKICFLKGSEGSSPFSGTTTTKSELFSDRRRVRIFCILWKTE